MASDCPEESFAALFEQSTRAAAKPRRPRVGDEVEAAVIQVGKEAVFVELPGHGRRSSTRSICGAPTARPPSTRATGSACAWPR